MSSSNNLASDLQQTLTDTYQQFANLSLDAVRPLMDNMFNSLSNVNQTIAAGQIPTLNSIPLYGTNSNCCRPQNQCPPRCIASIDRKAMAGEQIVVPFLIRNASSATKTYRVGVRDLVDNEGALAIAQPRLNKDAVTLDPGRSERVQMLLDLSEFQNGTVYTTEIVIREEEYNQNIWFRLDVDTHDAAVATPYNEKDYKQQWQSWQSHFYCEPPQSS